MTYRASTNSQDTQTVRRVIKLSIDLSEPTQEVSPQAGCSDRTQFGLSDPMNELALAANPDWEVVGGGLPAHARRN